MSSGVTTQGLKKLARLTGVPLPPGFGVGKGKGKGMKAPKSSTDKMTSYLKGQMTRRRQAKLVDSIEGIRKNDIKRLARRGGVKRINSLVLDETRSVLKMFLENVIRDCVTYMEHAKRKTITAMDVVYSLKRQGRVLYGFGA